MIKVSLTVKRIKKKHEPTRHQHYTEDNVHRYCTGRKAGKDTLVTSWFYVTCQKCRNKSAYDEALRKRMK